MTAFREALAAELGPAVTFDPQLTRAYDHDLGELPGIVMAQLGTVPDTVVAARTAEQVAAALRIAARHRVPITPRGQASSGYGGAIPVRGGLLLDLSPMNRVLAVDPDAATADVEPGVVWDALASRLRRSGLDLRLCPTSCPSSTVGGWFAMGGVGIGSFRYGSIGDVVLEADVAGLDGRIVTVTGPELELHHQTCGTLGVLTRLRLACRPAAPLRSFAVHLDDARAVTALLPEAQSRLAPYSITVSSAGYLRMRARAEGHAAPIDRGLLALVTVPEATADDAAVRAAAAAAGGRVLPAPVAEHEWQGRFYPMRVKKLGPALLVSEFYLPASRFGEVWPRVEAELSRDLVGVEAVAVRGDRMAILCYVLDRGDGLLFPLRMAKAMLPLRVAQRYGGSVYAPGLWFASETKRFLGADKHRAFRERKAQVDPHGLLNPGKLETTLPRWFPVVSLSWAMSVGAALAAPISRRLPSRRLPDSPNAS